MREGAVFVSGYFNILHPGHIRLLKFASELGRCLTVGVYGDALKQDAAVPEVERQQAVASLSFVDEVVILSTSPEEYIEQYCPQYVVKGWEFKTKQNPEQSVLNQYGGELVFSSGEFLSSSEAEQLTVSESNTSIYLPQKYIYRHAIALDKMHNIVTQLKQLNIAVIGDVIVDKYIECDAVGMSQEDPTIVVRPVNDKTYLGGAGIVAGHARGLDANVCFYSVIGDDSSGHFVRSELESQGITAHLLEDRTRPTIEKNRYRSKGKTMLRVNNYREHAISDELQQRMYQQLESDIQSLDAIIFSDFNYGVLPVALLRKIIQLANKHNVFLAADSQSSSQTGKIEEYIGVDLITPTEHEARLALKNHDDGLVTLAEKMRAQVEAKHIFITLSAEGLLINTGDSSIEKSGMPGGVTDRLKALQLKPIDTAGAGDALLVGASLSLTSGCNIWEAAYIGSLAAAKQVERMGNIPLTTDEILTAFVGQNIEKQAQQELYKDYNLIPSSMSSSLKKVSEQW